MKTVMAFGTFDLLHLGHLKYLQAAKRRGDRLVVVVARDATVRRLKGRAPYFNERERLEMVKALRVVDAAVLGGAGDRFKIIERVRPGVIVLGYDQREDEGRLKKRLKKSGVAARVVRVEKPYHPLRHKSSALKRVCTRA
ncbi:MAG: FAD synthase [Candidatus Micrarchaeota archaeon]|nr:FAD synthase [Candidatus Micrarchaeota archaeon]